jgi:hypothetical protein
MSKKILKPFLRQRGSYFRFLPLLTVAVFSTLVLGQTTFAESVSEGGSSTGWSQTVQLSVQATNAVIAVDVSSPLSGSGTTIDPFTTQNQSITLDVRLVGQGHLVLTDRDNNVVATYDKLTDEEEYIAFSATLGEIGGYNFTATYADLNDHGQIFNAVQVFVQYEAVPLPPFPLPPNTGTGSVVYLNGYAIPTLSLAFWLGLLAIIVLVVYKSVKRRQVQDVKTKSKRK